MLGTSVHTIAGLLGAAVTVCAYLALQLGLLRGQGYYYPGLNAVGACLVLFSLTAAFNLSSAIMQVIWITVSAVGIGRYYILSRISRLDPEEQSFVDKTMPGLGRIEARRLLNLATRGDGEPGMRLTEGGERNRNVYYLLSGTAEVRDGNTVIAEIGENTFVGDMGLMSDESATATVELAEPGRYLAFPVDALQKLLENDAEIRRHLKAALSRHLVDKLLRTSRDLADFRRSAADA